MESVKGAKRATIHTYLATSDVFREVVFGMSKQDAIDKAIETTKLVRSLTKDDLTCKTLNGIWSFLQSVSQIRQLNLPLRFVKPLKSLGTNGGKPMIFNLPATVEVAGLMFMLIRLNTFVKT